MTRPESQMLATIKRLQREQGQVPTRREIAAAMGLPPLGSRQRTLLFNLAEQGAVRLHVGQARGIEVVR
jgi:SOS-response transcriptional repressor LexA